ncbi:sigma factor [Nocardia sp. CA-128927]|uniref:sigma factor n=1 Tax=Nocardia sp. CA-128927 TaxID=3239975 RepID=UPI003D96399C
MREELIRRCQPLAEHIAGKFAGRGESFDNLLHIARVGMATAVYRFDPVPGRRFWPSSHRPSSAKYATTSATTPAQTRYNGVSRKSGKRSPPRSTR